MGFQHINPDEITPFDMNDPADRALMDRLRGLYWTHHIVNAGFARMRAEVDAMPSWEQMTLEAERRKDPLKAFLAEQKQAALPTTLFPPAIGHGGFRLGHPHGTVAANFPPQPSAANNGFGTPLNRYAQAALPYAEAATEFVVPGYYFANETRNQFNAATEAYARGDGWGTLGHGALGLLNGVATGADIAVGALAPYARVGGGALAAGLAHAAPDAARLADNALSHTSEFWRAWQKTHAVAPDYVSAVHPWGSYGNPRVLPQMRRDIPRDVQNFPDARFLYARKDLGREIPGIKFMKQELHMPGFFWWNEGIESA